jgi:hypothetical protein
MRVVLVYFLRPRDGSRRHRFIEDDATERVTAAFAAYAVIEECVDFGQNSLYPSWSRS